MLQAECGELRKKLEESRQQLDSNDQMIRWLNNQVRTYPCLRIVSLEQCRWVLVSKCNGMVQSLRHFLFTSEDEDVLTIWQVNEAQLHGAHSSKYSSYRPALHGVANTYATGVSTRLPLR